MKEFMQAVDNYFAIQINMLLLFNNNILQFGNVCALKMKEWLNIWNAGFAPHPNAGMRLVRGMTLMLDKNM